jgi:hypothetical protein
MTSQKPVQKLKSIGEMQRDALRDLFAECVEALIVGDFEAREQAIERARGKCLTEQNIHWVTEELPFQPQEYKRVFGELAAPLQQKLKEFDEVQIVPFFKGFYPEAKPN